MSRKTRVVAFFVVILAASSLLAIGVYSKMQQKRRSLSYDAASVKSSDLPEVISKVKELEIVGVKLTDEGTNTAHLQISVVNNSDEPCYALEFVSRGATDVSSQGANGYYDDPDNPIVAIPPHEMKTFTVWLGGMLEGPPIVLNAARFAGGKDRGEDREILELMHKDDVRARAEKLKKGEQP